MCQYEILTKTALPKLRLTAWSLYLCGEYVDLMMTFEKLYTFML